LNTRIKKCNKDGVDELLNSEFPIDYPVTETGITSLGLACTLPDKTPQNNFDNKQMV